MATKKRARRIFTTVSVAELVSLSLNARNKTLLIVILCRANEQKAGAVQTMGVCLLMRRTQVHPIQDTSGRAFEIEHDIHTVLSPVR